MTLPKLPLRALIADDHRLFRQGLIGLLKTRVDLVEVVGEAATGLEAVHLAQALQPDVILLDIQMPDGTGIEAIEPIRRHAPDATVIMLTACESHDHVCEAMRLGAGAYLLKSLDASELFAVLTSVAYGEVTLTRTMASRMLKLAAAHRPDDRAPNATLTAREVDVLRLVARGASNPQIAEALDVTTNTVKVHLRNILDKLQLDNRTQVATYAVRSGLVSVVDHLPVA